MIKNSAKGIKSFGGEKRFRLNGCQGQLNITAVALRKSKYDCTWQTNTYA